MIDSHAHPEAWGIRPDLFRIGSYAVPSYAFFVLLGVAVGSLVFFLQARKHRSASERTFYIFLAALVGGTLGAKLPYFVMNWRAIAAAWPDPGPLLTGRTIVGGLIGGALGVHLVKRRLHIEGRRGDLFVPAIALGVALGRIGCFLRGCCYGKPTSLPWGVDFGDGMARHPTQLYESVFLLVLLACIVAANAGQGVPGKRFRLFIVAYFGFRFVVEFVRAEPVVFLGLTAFQLVSAAVVFYTACQLLRPPFREDGGGLGTRVPL